MRFFILKNRWEIAEIRRVSCYAFCREDVNDMGTEYLFERKLNQDSSLQDALETLTVPELQGILFYMLLQEVEVEEKDLLIEQICRDLPKRAKAYAQCFDLERYRLFQEFLEADGVLSPPGIELPNMLTLLEMGLAYPAICNKKRVLVVPKEIRASLLELDPVQWEEAAACNTRLLQRAHGLLYYYGYLETADLFRLCMHKEAEDAFENVYFMEVLYTAVLYYGQIEPEEKGFRHKYYLYYSHVRTQQEKITNLPDYKVFPDAVLERAGQREYMEWTLAMERLKQFLVEKGHMPEQIARNEIKILWYDYNNGMDPGNICAYFTERYFSYNSQAMKEELQSLMMGMYYTMPLWLLHGYSFAELAERGDAEC